MNGARWWTCKNPTRAGVLHVVTWARFGRMPTACGLSLGFDDFDIAVNEDTGDYMLLSDPARIDCQQCVSVAGSLDLPIEVL